MNDTPHDLFHILLIDDSEADNFFHKIVIKDTGCARQIDVARHGEEGLELLRAARRGECASPEVIFLDINMPVMNGWEFLEAATEERLVSRETVVVTMLSTSNNPSDRQRASRYGPVLAYTTKPLTRPVLRSILADAFPERWCTGAGGP